MKMTIIDVYNSAFVSNEVKEKAANLRTEFMLALSSSTLNFKEVLKTQLSDKDYKKINNLECLDITLENFTKENKDINKYDTKWEIVLDYISALCIENLQFDFNKIPYYESETKNEDKIEFAKITYSISSLITTAFKNYMIKNCIDFISILANFKMPEDIKKHFDAIGSLLIQNYNEIKTPDWEKMLMCILNEEIRENVEIFL